MCQHCEQLERKIGRFQLFLNNGVDLLTTRNIERAIKGMEQLKSALHGDEAKRNVLASKPDTEAPSPMIALRTH